ncbi:hypothetical protein PINS_up023307 [Pythium insidiosum]|nr:hypothetical protein PINS_up023307 [Pythium insidiosum]
MYRSRVKIAAHGSQEMTATTTINAAGSSTQAQSLAQPLRFIPFQNPTINCDDTLCRRLTPSAPLRFRWILFLRLNGVLGLALTGASFGIGLGFFGGGRSATQLTISTRLAQASLIPTSIFIAPFAVSYQRQLLRQLLRNFDVIFCSFQFVSACVCLADLLQWSAICWSIITWALWFHWLLLLDAIAPPARAALGFRKRHASPVLLAFVLGVSVLVFSLFLHRESPLVDRVAVLRLTTHTTIAFHSSTFMVYRLLTVVLWLLRLAFEVECCGEHELMLIRGAVEYVSPLEVFPASAQPTVAPLQVATQRSPISAIAVHAAQRSSERASESRRRPCSTRKGNQRQ